MARTRRGFGRIEKRGPGRFRAAYVGPDTVLHRAPHTFTTREDAEAWLSARRAEIRDEDWTPKRKVSPILFREYADQWVRNRRVKGQPLKPRTRYHYEKMLEDRIYPTFGDVALKHITAELVGEWYSRMDDEKPTAKAHAYSLLRSILATASSEPLGAPLIKYNPAHIRGASGTTRLKKIAPATLPQIEALTKAMPERYRLMVLLSAWCALRFGEVTELRRKDIDLTNGVIKVSRAVIRVKGDFIVGTPKSEAGKRDVPIAPHLLPVVRAHLANNITGGRDGLLFPSAGDPTKHLAPATLYKVFYKARDAAGRPDLRWHDLRHTALTNAAVAGATLSDLKSLAGHSTNEAAMRYQHSAQSRMQEIAERMSALATANIQSDTPETGK